MNTLEYLDAVKARIGITSDYALAKRLHITPSTISNYRISARQMDDETAAKVADLLEIHPGLVMLDMHRARAKTPGEASIWQDIYTGFRVPSLHAKTGMGHSPAW